ncbi:hypothetical protein [Streptomyces olivaceoviridis]|uniref:hypothetical protein n=1 Tax=Streptomyces olivaceoviridis TaxID=1921 RepID=UPI00367D7B09
MMSGLPVRVYVLSALLAAVWTAGGGFGGWSWGGVGWAVLAAVVAGLTAGAGMALFIRRAAASARREQARRLRQAESRGETEGTTDAVLMAVALYKAAVFPLVAGSVSAEEQQARRTVAYRMSAYDSLPRQVRLSAAEALEAIDDGQDAEAARTTLQALTMAVYDCRLHSRWPNGR